MFMVILTMFKLNLDHVQLYDVDPLCFLANRGIYRLSAYFFCIYRSILEALTAPDCFGKQSDSNLPKESKTMPGSALNLLWARLGQDNFTNISMCG